MRVVVSIEVSATDAAQVELLLKDALGEFVTSRTPVSDYVHQRYADQDELFRSRKADEVRARIILAGGLRLGLKVEVAHDEPVPEPTEKELEKAASETTAYMSGAKPFKNGKGYYTKIVLIKAVRNERGIDLKAAKDLVDLWEKRGLL